MIALRRWLARLAASARALTGVGARRADDELREEMAAHLAMHIAENLRRGLTSDEARRAALVASGGLTAAAESAREQRGLPLLEGIVSDVRYAARALVAKPGYSIAVVLTLALGIGANTAMFTIVNAVVLRPLPYPQPDRLVSISTSSKGQDRGVVDDVNYVAWRDNAHTLTLSLASGTDGVFSTAGGPEELSGMQVSTAYFSVFGVRPIMGRTFTEDEDRPGGPAVVVVRDDLRKRLIGADESILGHVLTIDGVPHTVIGVLPASFATSRHALYWVPFRMREPEQPHALTPGNPGISTFFYAVYARLHDGASIESARTELAGITKRAELARPVEWRGISPVVMTIHERRFGDRRKPLLLLFSAVGVLLVITCANLANLSLARAVSRQREMGVRLALGAGRWRLARALLCESTLLALAGAVLALLVAKGAVGYMVHLSPPSLGGVDGISLDPAVLAFTLGVALITGFAFGIAPAVGAARGDINHVLSSSGLRSTSSNAQQTTQRLLVVAQLATALVLLTSAGLVTRTFLRVASIETGFVADNLTEVTLRLPKPRYTEASATPFFEELLAKIRALPGVTSASFVHGSPMGRVFTFTMTDSAGNKSEPIDAVEAGSDYFRTIGATIREGRGFDSGDRAGGERVAVINELLARRLFPQGGALGHTIPFQGSTVRVVGIVKNVLQKELEAEPSAVLYLPIAQQGIGTYVSLMIRTEGPPVTLQRSIVGMVRAIDPTLAPPPVTSMADVVARQIAPRQFTFVLLGIFAALAALLAVLGLYGVLANLVADRRREIGIRVALGADPRRVTGLVLGQGAALAVVGVLIGVGGSAVAVRALRSLVYNVSIYDPWAFVTGAALLILVSLAASYFPARRASRVDPVIALRAE